MSYKITKETALLLQKSLSTDTDDFLQTKNSAGTVKSALNYQGGIVLGGATKVAQSVAQVTLTAAQIIAMFTTPVAILPAPAAGQAYVVHQITVELNLTATAFTGGGVVHFYYHGLTVELMAQTIAAATIQGGAAQTIWTLQPVATAGGSVITKELGIDITNATAVFAAGTGTAVVTIRYSTITLG